MSRHQTNHVLDETPNQAEAEKQDEELTRNIEASKTFLRRNQFQKVLGVSQEISACYEKDEQPKDKKESQEIKALGGIRDTGMIFDPSMMKKEPQFFLEANKAELDNVMHLKELALHYFKFGDNEESLNHSTKLCSLLRPNCPNDSISKGVYCEAKIIEAKCYANQDNYEKAKEILKETHNYDPKNPDVHIATLTIKDYYVKRITEELKSEAESFCEAHNYSDALSTYNKCLEKIPRDDLVSESYLDLLCMKTACLDIMMTQTQNRSSFAQEIISFVDEGLIKIEDHLERLGEVDCPRDHKIKILDLNDNLEVFKIYLLNSKVKADIFLGRLTKAKLNMKEIEKLCPNFAKTNKILIELKNKIESENDENETSRD